MHHHLRHTRGDRRTAPLPRKPEGARLPNRRIARAPQHAEHGKRGGGSDRKLRNCRESSAKNKEHRGRNREIEDSGSHADREKGRNWVFFVFLTRIFG